MVKRLVLTETRFDQYALLAAHDEVLTVLKELYVFGCHILVCFDAFEAFEVNAADLLDSGRVTDYQLAAVKEEVQHVVLVLDPVCQFAFLDIPDADGFVLVGATGEEVVKLGDACYGFVDRSGEVLFYYASRGFPDDDVSIGETREDQVVCAACFEG